MATIHHRLPLAAVSTLLFALASLPLAASAQTVLENGVPVTGISAPAGTELAFVIEVPEGSHELLVQSSSGSGDADLYIRHAQMPTLAVFDCASDTFRNPDACLVETPAAGQWFILVHAYTAFEGVLLMASFDDQPAQITPLQADVDLPVSGPIGSISWFSVEVPEDSPDVVVEIFPVNGSTGDGDLYVRFGERPLPNHDDWDCRPFIIGNDEQCILSDPQAGTWYVGVHVWPASGALSNVRILSSSIPGDLSVTLSGARMRPDHTLAWVGGAEDVDVWLNGSIVFTGANTGSYTQRVPVFVGATNWLVCNAGTDQCSN